MEKFETQKILPGGRVEIYGKCNVLEYTGTSG
jgi:hypothetical protein